MPRNDREEKRQSIKRLLVWPSCWRQAITCMRAAREDDHGDDTYDAIAERSQRG
jgi:hypothetical protein